MGRESTVIVDIAVPFEETGSLQEARHVKITKYSVLANWLQEAKGRRTMVQALVVGALGSWDPDNKFTLEALQVESNTFKKQCVLEAIRGSSAIWNARCKN